MRGATGVESGLRSVVGGANWSAPLAEREDAGAGGPGGPFSIKLADEFRLTGGEVIHLRAVELHIVEFPRLLLLGDLLPPAIADRAVPSCSQKSGWVRPSSRPAKAGRRLTPSIGWIAVILHHMADARLVRIAPD